MLVRNGIFYEEQNDKLIVIGLENKLYSGDVHIPEQANGKHVVGIAPRAFKATSISRIFLPYTLEKIGEEAFSYCNMLEEVYLTGRTVVVKNHILHIEKQAFEHCSSLKNFETTKSLLLEQYSFCCCHKLSDIDTILVIKENALKDCMSLKYVFFDNDCDLTNFNVQDTGIKKCEFRGNAITSQEFLDSIVQKQCTIECFADSNLCELAFYGFNVSINELPF